MNALSNKRTLNVILATFVGIPILTADAPYGLAFAILLYLFIGGILGLAICLPSRKRSISLVWYSVILLAAMLPIAGYSTPLATATVSTNEHFAVKGSVVFCKNLADQNTPFTNSFEMVVDGCMYSIVVPNPVEYDQISKEECVFDGEKCITSLVISSNYIPIVTQLKNGRPVEQPAKRRNMATSTVSDGLRPQTPSADSVTLLWLAFLSKCLNPSNETRDSPIFNMGLAYVWHDIKVTRRWVRSQLPPFFGQTMTELHDGSSFSVPLREGGGEIIPSEVKRKLVKTRLRPPLHKGYTNAVFSVVGWTNIAHETFPARFLLELFLPSGPSTLRRVARWEGFVTNISATPVPIEPKSAVLPLTRVKETRTSTIGGKLPFTYFSRDGSIYTSDKLRSLPEFRRRSTSAAIRPQGFLARAVTYLFFLALLSAPFVSAVVRAKKK